MATLLNRHERNARLSKRMAIMEMSEADFSKKHGTTAANLIYLKRRAWWQQGTLNKMCEIFDVDVRFWLVKECDENGTETALDGP